MNDYLEDPLVWQLKLLLLLFGAGGLNLLYRPNKEYFHFSLSWSEWANPGSAWKMCLLLLLELIARFYDYNDNNN